MRRIAPGLAAIAGLVTLAGCFNPFSPQVLSQRVTSAAPTPNSPQNAVKLFEWCWVNRGVDEYRELFTDDYVFISAGTDSAGNPSRDIQARRDDEVQTAENMFIGSAERAPAEQITLLFDQNLVPFPDSRPGKNALFFITRGDSAAIPAELKSRGFAPDSLRWWIDRWEDETLGDGAVQASRLAHARISGSPIRMSMGQLKRIYKSTP